MKELPIFVYGTLKAGGIFDIFKNFKREEIQASLPGAALYDLGAFPALKLEGENTVRGEVHFYANSKIYQHVLQRMDFIEGFNKSKNDLFTRKIVNVKTKIGKQQQAYCYVYNGKVDQKMKIVSGIWECS
ncbi:MAG: gamma-glutamylcyclotransferase [Candidatus Cloacimonetes bacterium]|nr:gamma-glutamylcyclotransferase [Candidatus Cloacimonadota bacterium]MCF7884806.1 gamma-glutamylcyclotransferase [Candidatus Cloacimonadota bacterium]